jgi:hypothetical protein
MADTFRWNGLELEYFDHLYNHTMYNMRRVEIPIVRWFIEQSSGARILEIGNVLSHYGRVTWQAVDLREAVEIQADVMAWRPAQPVDLLISISTVEHIGFGKYAGKTAPTTPADVLRRLRSFLAPGGRAVVTAPTAYNPMLDEQAKRGALGVERMWCMRVVNGNEWEECTLDEALAMSPTACAGRWRGGLMIMVMECP